MAHSGSISRWWRQWFGAAEGAVREDGRQRDADPRQPGSTGAPTLAGKWPDSPRLVIGLTSLRLDAPDATADEPHLPHLGRGAS